eukprot:CAMPEP_0175186454 /NCGR_PEP_ID=MMETSP0093-20121207/2399_1 /TAXON_ID=311494 /ORGANISM="Alexandrium monilatum, Strain CCMP3105" /LENGTH=198 /DNA_ID=CAMNT_0016479175 /DNA_START=121 /DNA_END=713 /DNA_ORIENTATION=-
MMKPGTAPSQNHHHQVPSGPSQIKTASSRLQKRRGPPPQLTVSGRRVFHWPRGHAKASSPEAPEEVHRKEECQGEDHQDAHVAARPLLHHPLQVAHGARQQGPCLVKVGAHRAEHRVRVLRLLLDRVGYASQRGDPRLEVLDLCVVQVCHLLPGVRGVQVFALPGGLVGLEAAAEESGPLVNFESICHPLPHGMARAP